MEGEICHVHLCFRHRLASSFAIRMCCVVCFIMQSFFSEGNDVDTVAPHIMIVGIMAMCFFLAYFHRKRHHNRRRSSSYEEESVATDVSNCVCHDFRSTREESNRGCSTHIGERTALLRDGGGPIYTM